MNTPRLVRALAVAALFAPLPAHAAGYALYEQGAAALGMAGAYVASVHDATALFYNPAAMVRMPGALSLGGSWLSTYNSFAGSQPTANAYPGFNVRESMKTGNFFPPHAYLTGRLGTRWAYGLGVNAPFGLGVEWEHPGTFTGRELATKATLRSLASSATLAFGLTEKLSVSAGLTELWGGVELNQILLSPPLPGGGGGQVNVAAVQLKSDMRKGTGMNAALLWLPSDQWRLGVNYRGGIDVKVTDGKATFTQMPSGSAALDSIVRLSLPPSQTVATTLHFPALLSLGAAWRPLPGWTWEGDVNWTQWTAFDELKLKFNTTPGINTAVVENYHDSYRISVGAEHQLDSYAYRFGYYYDQDAAPPESVTPLLPDATRHGVTLGLGFQMGAQKSWSLDVYNLALFVEKRGTEGISRDHYDGVYKAFVNSLGLTIGHHW